MTFVSMTILLTHMSVLGVTYAAVFIGLSESSDTTQTFRKIEAIRQSMAIVWGAAK